MMMKTCWFLCVSPLSSLRAALQKYCTQPCLPRKVEGRPRGRPSLKGKLWMPAERRTESPPESEIGCYVGTFRTMIIVVISCRLHDPISFI